MTRFRTTILFALGAAALCLSGCVAAEKNEYRDHLSMSVSQSPTDGEAIMMFLGREPILGSLAVVDSAQPP